MMSDRKVELSVKIDGEWKQLKHVDMGRDDQSVAYVLKSTGETVTLDDEKIKVFLKACMADVCDDNKIQNYQLELYKRIIMAGSNADIFGGRRSGRRFMFQEIARIREETQNSAFSFKTRHCDCLKCRMGQSHQCMTFSPKKRRGK